MNQQTEAIKMQTEVIEGINNQEHIMNNSSKQMTWATYVLAVATFILAVATSAQIYSSLTAQGPTPPEAPYRQGISLHGRATSAASAS